MPEQSPNRHKHFVLQNTSRPIRFRAHSAGGRTAQEVPPLPRIPHGGELRRQLGRLKALSNETVNQHKEQRLKSRPGLQIRFIGQPDVPLAIESLANEPKGIELLAVRQEDRHTVASVFVPDGGMAHFEHYISDYLKEKKDKRGRSLDHRRLVDAIASIQAIDIQALWTDDPTLFPTDPSEIFWWEVWLPIRGARHDVLEDFRVLAREAGCMASSGHIAFPERTVLALQGSCEQLFRSPLLLNCIAELRAARETADFFSSLEPLEQREWVDDLLNRIQLPVPGDSVPHICLLDSGVTRGHPLLAPLIDATDLHTVEPAWGLHDTLGHGTGQAGLAIYGDLTDALSSTAPVPITHRLESVKLVSHTGANTAASHPNAARLHADLFREAVSRPEITVPDRSRVFACAVTAQDHHDAGRPTSWSAEIDALAADTAGSGKHPRLIIQSAGNTTEPARWADYPHSLENSSIHDPAQAFNAITVGACTHKADTGSHPSLKPVAAPGGPSPFTTTSAGWASAWPLKPDLVLEGGNAAQDSFSAVWMSHLSLLTTHHEPLTRSFTTSNATSAATALCARMAVQIMSAYPQLRSETVRGLLVHSGRWTNAMKALYLPQEQTPAKDDYIRLIQHCGWGIPDLGRALWSVSSALTMIIEDQLVPYAKRTGGSIETQDMNLHTLPLPREALEALQDTPIQMCVTLSYFIEPNPSSRGSTSKYHYPSHRLRFDVQRPLETTQQFISRLNAAAELDDAISPAKTSDANWLLGTQRRHRGSLHQDVWTGTAAELANRGFIAVYPASGWWRSRPALAGYNRSAPYSLIVSIHTPQTGIDLYTAVSRTIEATSVSAIHAKT